MGRPLKRRLIQSKMAGKRIRCKSCLNYIKTGEAYTYCAIIGYWGSYHNDCFKDVSINLETKDTGEYLPSSSQRAFSQSLTGKILSIKATNEGR